MSDFTMGLAEIMANQNKVEAKPEPSESVKLYTLIKDYAQRKYKCDDNQVMRLYIGTKHYAKITDNSMLIAYVDGKMNPEKPKPVVKQPEIKNSLSVIKDSFDDSVLVEEYKDKIKITVADSKQETDIKNKMKENGYKYSTKRGLSYFFVK